MSTASEPKASELEGGRSAARKRPLRLRLNLWLRWLHVYTSMLSLLIVLFFALTGITLNHPDWAFGGAEVRREVKGTLPADWRVNGQVNWLTVAETLRAAHGLHGRAGEERADDQEASLSFKAPGYSADAFIQVPSGKYSLSIDSQGALAVLNDLHRGRDAGGAWGWVIDLSGGFLALVALTGLGLLLYLKKIRALALLVMLGGAAAVIALMSLAA